MLTDATSALYCSNADFSYTSGNRDFTSPTCRTLMPIELSERSALPPSVFFTTAFVETVTRGWPCSSDPNNTRSLACRAGGAQSFGRINGQCGCVSTQAVYPLGAEEMTMAFEHSFSVPATTVESLRGATRTCHQHLTDPTLTHPHPPPTLHGSHP